MAFPELGCVRCPIPCVASGHTKRARRSLGQGRTLLRGSLDWLAVWVRCMSSHQFVIPPYNFDCPLAGGIAGLVGNPGGLCPCPPSRQWTVTDVGSLEIVMVRLQGDFAKPPEKRFNYKHCFDALFRVRWFLVTRLVL